MPASAKQLLMAGVTSARDLGAPLEASINVRNRINEGKIPGPTMAMSGPFIQHGYAPGTELFRWGVKGPDDARAKVRARRRGGVDVIKLIDQDQMTIDEVKAVVDEAHRRGKPVVAHAHRPEEIRRGLAVGVDCFEHGIGQRARISRGHHRAAARAHRQHGARPAVLDADDRRALQLRVNPRQPGASR